MRFNPRDLVERLIREDYRIPIYQDLITRHHENPSDSFMEASNSYIPLRYVLEYMKHQIELAWRDAPKSHRDLWFSKQHEIEKLKNEIGLLKDKINEIQKKTNCY